MTFDYGMKADGSQAVAESRKVEESLVRVEEKAKAAGAAMSKGFELKDSAGRFLGTSVAAQQLGDKVRAAASASEAFQAKLRTATQRSEESGRAMSRAADVHARLSAVNTPLVRSFEGLSAALQKETALLESIRGPTRQHAEDVMMLSNMYKRGTITSQEYLATLSRIDGKKAAGGHGGGNSPAAFSKEGASELLSSHGGAGGGLLSGVMEGGIGALGTVAAVGAVVGIAHKAAEAIIELGDAYTELSNKALKMSTSSQGVNAVLDNNLHMSTQLHASLRETMELNDAMKDGTEELNLTTAQQGQLSRGLGAAVRLSGKDLSEAGGLMNKLSFSFANGTVTAGEFKGMIKAFPDLMGIMQSSTGKSRDELFRMAKAGELTADMITNAATQAGDAMVEKLGDRLETTGEKMQHLKDRAAVAWGGIAQIASQALGKVIDGLTDIIDPMQNYREEQERANHAATFEAEINEKMVASTEKLIHTRMILAALPAAAKPEGSDFDLNVAQSYARLRMTMSEVTIEGVNMGAKMKDPMELLNSKAMQLENRIQALIDQHAGEKMAADADKAYRSWANVNTVIDEQSKSIDAALDRVLEYDKALAILAKNRQDFAKRPNPVTEPNLMSPTEPSTFLGGQAGMSMNDQDTLILRGKADAVEDYKVKIGELGSTSAQAKKQLRDHDTALADVIRDHQRGATSAKEFAEALKLLGVEESRMTKILREIRQPFVDLLGDTNALDALHRAGLITMTEYTTKLNKLVEAYRGYATVSQFGRQGNLNIAANDNLLGPNGDKWLEKQKQLEEGATNIWDPGILEQAGDAKDQLVSMANAKHAQDMMAFQAQLYSGGGAGGGGLTAGFGTDRNDVAFKSKSIDEATMYTKRWNEELAHSKQRMADIDKFGQQVFGHIEDSLVTLVTTGKFSFKSLVNSILADLTRLAAHRLLMSLIGGAMGGGGYASVTGSGATQSFPGFLSGGAHADGAPYTVPGTGGPDSQNVVFRLTPGEQVHFTPPGASGPVGANSGGVEIHNHFNPRDLPGSLNGNAGRRVIHNMIRKQRGFGK